VFLAAVRLMTISSLVGNSTGKSACEGTFEYPVNKRPRHSEVK
jgi:hypothetical protein